MITGLACILINSRVVRTTEDQIAYTVRGDVEIRSFALDSLKSFGADCIMVLDHGRIIERGNHEKLIAEHGTYYQLYTGAFELE